MSRPSRFSHWVRQSHRWVSIAFTLAVLANIAVMSTGQGQPPPLVTYSPLLPLFFLLFSGLYMFALPYTAKWRRTQSSRTAETQ